MRTYHGERTNSGCVVTVDGLPLHVRSDLSGNATTAFDWGYIGGGQLSLSLLADFFHCDKKAKAMAETFEKHVLAELPMDSWSLTDYALTTALAPLIGEEGARSDDAETEDHTGAAFGDMPVSETDFVQNLKAEDASAARAMASEGGGTPKYFGKC